MVAAASRSGFAIALLPVVVNQDSVQLRGPSACPWRHHRDSQQSHDGVLSATVRVPSFFMLAATQQYEPAR